MNPLNQWTCTVGWLSVPLCRRIVRQVLFDMCNVWFMMAFLLFYGGKGNAFYEYIPNKYAEMFVFRPFFPQTPGANVVYLVRKSYFWGLFKERNAWPMSTREI